MAIVIYKSKEGIKVCEIHGQSLPKKGDDVRLPGLRDSKVKAVDPVNCKVTLEHDYGVLMDGNKS